MRALTSAILLLLTCAAVPAAASVFKCADEKAKSSIRTCPAAPELRNFDTDPPALTVILRRLPAAAPPRRGSRSER